jgi:hypothetical protein
MKVYYLVHKAYKGIFRKKFKENLSILGLHVQNAFMLFAVVGEIIGTDILKQTYLINPIMKTSPLNDVTIIEELQNPEYNTILVEEIPCTLKKSKDGYSIDYTLTKKGTYIPKQFNIHAKAYENGDIVDLLTGDFNFVSRFEEFNKNQFKMAINKQNAFMNKFKTSLKNIKIK